METANVKGIFGEAKGIVTPTYKEQAYQLIKEAIIYQRFVAGEVYSQEGICRELGISRTPVREALLELQKAGYIRFSRGRGITIVPVTDEEAKSILEMRVYNERYSAKLAARRATREDLDAIEEILVEMDAGLKTGTSEELYEKDRHFHQAIIAAGKNLWLNRIIKDLRDNYLRFENRSPFDDLDIRKAVLEEHRRIFREIEKHNEEAADLAMKEHLTKTYHRTVNQIELD